MDNVKYENPIVAAIMAVPENKVIAASLLLLKEFFDKYRSKPADKDAWYDKSLRITLGHRLESAESDFMVELVSTYKGQEVVSRAIVEIEKPDAQHTALFFVRQGYLIFCLDRQEILKDPMSIGADVFKGLRKESRKKLGYLEEKIRAENKALLERERQALEDLYCRKTQKALDKCQRQKDRFNEKVRRLFQAEAERDEPQE